MDDNENVTRIFGVRGMNGEKGARGEMGYTLEEMLDKTYGPRGTRRRERIEIVFKLKWNFDRLMSKIENGRRGRHTGCI